MYLVSKAVDSNIHGFFLSLCEAVEMQKVLKISVSLLFGAAVMLFWALAYPQALGFREQNQIFFYTWDYVAGKLSLAGGFADLIAGFVVQFYRLTWIGAFLTAAIFVILQRSVWKLSEKHFCLSFIPPVLLLILMGDLYVSLCFAIALASVCRLSVLHRKYPSTAFALIAIPASFWLFGPVSLLFVCFAILDGPRKNALILPVYSAAIIIAAGLTLLCQYSWRQILLGISYYDRPLAHPWLMPVSAISCLVIPAIARILREPDSKAWIERSICTVVLCLTAAFGVNSTYGRDTYEIIAYDQLIRAEKWAEVISRAEKYQPRNELACVSVNLSLFMCGRMNEMSEFYQCGTKGLLMPRVRDNVSNISTGEAFWRLGFVNEALRYAFDTQEAIPDCEKSPRSMMRMAECQIVNGRYKVASKYIDLLKHTMFYRSWALEHEKYLGNEALIESNPIYHYLRIVRNREDYLFHYPEMDKMLGRLYLQCKENIMAGWYYQAWMSLRQYDDENKGNNSASGVHGS